MPAQNSRIQHWIDNANWPPTCFEPDVMEQLRARKKAGTSGQPSLWSSTATDQQDPAKSAPYKSAGYEQELEKKGAYMREHPLGISEGSQALCLKLLDTPQNPPQGTLFDDAVFQRCCDQLQCRNKDKIQQDATPLLVPSAQTLALHGAKHLDKTIESVKEAWTTCIPVLATCPQPDHAVGLQRSAFSSEQRAKMVPILARDHSYQSYCEATLYMLFPFLACEVRANDGIDTADRRNAHTMTIAAKAIAMLYTAVGAEAEIDREILGFSLSHDDERVKIWGHYAVFEANKPLTFWRHPVRDVFSTDPTDIWKAYQFTRNVYDIFLQHHVDRISSAIDKLPDPGPAVAPGTAVTDSLDSLADPMELFA